MTTRHERNPLRFGHLTHNIWLYYSPTESWMPHLYIEWELYDGMRSREFSDDGSYLHKRKAMVGTKWIRIEPMRLCILVGIGILWSHVCMCINDKWVYVAFRCEDVVPLASGCVDHWTRQLQAYQRFSYEGCSRKAITYSSAVANSIHEKLYITWMTPLFPWRLSRVSIPFHAGLLRTGTYEQPDNSLHCTSPSWLTRDVGPCSLSNAISFL